MTRSVTFALVAFTTVFLILIMALTGRDSSAQARAGAAIATTADGSAAWVAGDGGVQFCRVRAPLTDRPDVTCFPAKKP